MHSDWTGRGIATDAALTDAAFGLPGIDRVEIYHDAAGVTQANERSAARPWQHDK